MRIITVLLLTLSLCSGLGTRIYASSTQNSDQTAVLNNSNNLVALAKKVVPSVVNISTLSTVRSPYSLGTPDDLFRRFFEEFFGRNYGSNPNGRPDEPSPGPRQERRLPKAISLGSGFIIDSSGIILTNNHVVAGADEIKIHFTEEADETPTDGEVVGRDPDLDVALIRVKSKREMIPLPLGDSDRLEVGEYVAAVGNPFGQGHTTTHGIISAKGRANPEFPLGSYLQTDAPINPGNSGGPLVNLNGEVVGINTAIEARAQGIGFAIPINLVKTILPQLRSKGVVIRGYAGILVGPLTKEIAEQLKLPKDLQAPLITQVFKGEPADQAGLKPYDVVLEFNKKPVRSPNELVTAVTSVPVGQSVPVKVLRNGKKMDLTLTVRARPTSQTQETHRNGQRQKEPEPSSIKTGMSLENLTPEMTRQLGIQGQISGVLVSDVAPGSPADVAGISRGDIIVEVDQKPIQDKNTFQSLVNKKKSYLLRIRRPNPQGIENYAVVVLDLKNE